MAGEAAGLRMYGCFLNCRAPQLDVSRELLRPDSGSFYLAGVRRCLLVVNCKAKRFSRLE
jgi:hypothetical protein